MLKSAVVVWSILTIIMTILPILKFDHWWIRAFDFPRIQIIALTALNLLVFISIFNTSSFWLNLILVLLSR